MSPGGAGAESRARVDGWDERSQTPNPAQTPSSALSNLILITHFIRPLALSLLLVNTRGGRMSYSKSTNYKVWESRNVLNTK